ncbi:hypothetical protein F5148DRAFT_1284792 [Russula earlei]|uniref:Uncharacterized protein n=1 Tax=Russula earlei TaxID=71964 RepID=A0ACC0U8F5_9AGAM|nr:hypothetical protein F5148DRAFT_1284792 [Russula earlei]
MNFFKNITKAVLPTALDIVSDFIPVNTVLDNIPFAKEIVDIGIVNELTVRPIVEEYVGRATFRLTKVFITDPTQNDFKATLSGSVADAGPFDAVLKFNRELTVEWFDEESRQFKTFGTLDMPELEIGKGSFEFNDVVAIFKVNDCHRGALEKFVMDLFTKEKLEWRISCEDLTATLKAKGVIVKDIELPPKLVSLRGWNNLDKCAEIKSVDLPGNDTVPGIRVTLDTMITNPSEIGIALDSISFQYYIGNTKIGRVVSTGSFSLNSGPSTKSRLRLTDHLTSDISTVFCAVQGSGETAFILGESAGRQDIQWLNNAIKKLKVEKIEVPRLKTLLESVSLKLPRNVTQTKRGDAFFALKNPFTAPVQLVKLTNTTVTCGKWDVGTINCDLSSKPLDVNDSSRALPFAFNLKKPLMIIELLRSGAATNRVVLGPLDDLLTMAESYYNSSAPQNDIARVQASVPTKVPTLASGKQFDITGAILKSLENLKVTLRINSQLMVDNRKLSSSMSMQESHVPAAIRDGTALYLIGAIAPPIVQTLVEKADFRIKEATMTNRRGDKFELELNASLTKTGPLDAEIEFKNGVIVTWEGHDVAEITSLSKITAVAYDGCPKYRAKNARVKIIDRGRFPTDETLRKGIECTFHTKTLRVSALGTTFDGVSFSKVVTWKATVM